MMVQLTSVSERGPRFNVLLNNKLKMHFIGKLNLLRYDKYGFGMMKISEQEPRCSEFLCDNVI